jgi:HrpA-like RNA helicase
MSVAERVAYERLEKVGDSVGYQIRLQSRVSEQTKLVFCTTGVLLSQIQDPSFLESVSHVIIDEVHERQVRY